MSDSLKRALVAGHADFAAGMISAVELITGRGDVLVPIQVTGLCSDDIQKLLHSSMVGTGVNVIFTDLQAGSCTMAARRVLRDIRDGVLIAGTNLPMLLDFVLSTNASAGEAATTAAERGRTSVSVYTGTPA
jgi:PTS system N-acetylgalactosamine-specific IIA component